MFAPLSKETPPGQNDATTRVGNLAVDRVMVHALQDLHANNVPIAKTLSHAQEDADVLAAAHPEVFALPQRDADPFLPFMIAHRTPTQHVDKGADDALTLARMDPRF